MRGFLSVSSNSSNPSHSDEEPEEKIEETAEAFRERVQQGKLAAVNYTYEKLEELLIQNRRIFVYDNFNTFTLWNCDDTFMEFGFSAISPEERKNRKETKNVGWKIHIAIDDSDNTNLRKGFDLIKNIIIDEELICKVVKPGAAFYSDEDRNGRQITIYGANDQKDWQMILTKIENALTRENIQTTQCGKGDNPINGSRMIGYRNDDKGDGTYISAKDSGYKYNYCNAVDHLERVHLSFERSIRP